MGVTIVGRSPGIVPIVALSIVKDMAVPAEPEPAVAGYAIPFRVTTMATASGAIWIKVKGEPAGVHALPVTPYAHCELDPVPGATLCRSKATVPLAVLNVAKALMTSGPGVVRPGRFLIAPFVSPEKEPLFGFPGVSGLAPVLLPLTLKKTPVVLMVILPETLPEPVTDWAVAGEARVTRLMRNSV